MSSTRREYPRVNDEIVDRQRRVSGSVIGELPRDVTRRANPVADLERQLVAAYNTPSETDEAFLAAARELAEALHRRAS